jgi:predicted RecB family endonuclease
MDHPNFSRMSYPNNSGPSFNFFAWIAATIVALVIMAGVMIFLVVKDIGVKVQDKINAVTEPVIVAKYDSAAEVKMEKIEVYRQMSHQHIDNLYDHQLQDVLDSAFNAE